MKKVEAKEALCYLMYQWRKDRGFESVEPDRLSYYDFKNWLIEKHYSLYLNFRTTTSVDFDVELWFNRQFCRSEN